MSTTENKRTSWRDEQFEIRKWREKRVGRLPTTSSRVHDEMVRSDEIFSDEPPQGDYNLRADLREAREVIFDLKRAEKKEKSKPSRPTRPSKPSKPQ